MTGSVIRNIINRKKYFEKWGNLVELTSEKDFSICEYTINVGNLSKIEIKTDCYFIIVSGTAEFKFQNKTKKIFKGEKILINGLASGEIINCERIPLVLMQVILNKCGNIG